MPSDQTANERIRDGLIRHQMGIFQVSGHMRNSMVSLIDKTNVDLRNLLNERLEKIKQRGVDFGPATTKRLESFERAFATLMQPTQRNIESLVNTEMLELGENEFVFLDDLLKSSLPVQINFNLPTSDQLRSIVFSRPMQGRILKDWLEDWGSADRRRVMEQLRIGMTLGETNAQLRKRILGTTSLSGRNGVRAVTERGADFLARTVTNAVSNNARQAYYKRNSNIIKKEVYSATLDINTTIQCFRYNTKVQPLGNTKRAYRRSYTGEMITITTSSGNKIEATPNHPVLTSSGWRPLHEVKPGDKVYNTSLSKRVSIFGHIPIKMKANIGAFFDSIAKPAVGYILRSGAAAHQFHGDGMGVNHEVDIAVPNGNLSAKANPIIGKNVRKSLLTGSHFSNSFPCSRSLGLHGGTRFPGSKSSPFDSVALQDSVKPSFVSTYFDYNFRWAHTVFKHLNSFLFKLGVPVVPGSVFHGSNGLEIVGDSGDGNAVLTRKFTCANAGSIFCNNIRQYSKRLKLVARDFFHNANLFKARRDIPNRDSVFLAKGANGSAVSVFEENIVDISVEFCHNIEVYNLETSLGLYVAGGIIVKNCGDLDGDIFDVNKGPIPPIHGACRSTRYPWIDGVDLGKRGAVNASKSDLAGLTGKARRDKLRELTGSVPASQPFEVFLRGRDRSFIDEYLKSKTKGDLFVKGKLPLDRFVDSNLKPIPVRDLRIIEKDLFEKLGI